MDLERKPSFCFMTAFTMFCHLFQVIVSILFAPNNLVDTFLDNLAVVNNRLYFYLVTLTNTAVSYDSFFEDSLPLDEMNSINPSFLVAPETGYFSLARSSSVATELIEQ